MNISPDSVANALKGKAEMLPEADEFGELNCMYRSSTPKLLKMESYKELWKQKRLMSTEPFVQAQYQIKVTHLQHLEWIIFSLKQRRKLKILIK